MASSNDAVSPRGRNVVEVAPQVNEVTLWPDRDVESDALVERLVNRLDGAHVEIYDGGPHVERGPLRCEAGGPIG